MASPLIRRRQRNRPDIVPSYPKGTWTPPAVRFGEPPPSTSHNRFLQDATPDRTPLIIRQPRRWWPSVRVVGIVLGLSALAFGGVMLYRMGPPVALINPLSLLQQTPRRPAENIPDVHPTTLAPAKRAATKTEPTERTTVPTAGSAQSEVLTVVATPAGHAPQSATATRSSEHSGADASPAPRAGNAAGTGAAREPGSAVAFIASSHVYSAEDVDVIPPETINPQKLGNLRTGAIKPDDKVTIEVLINVEGYVEEARGRTAPRNVGESLLLATSLHAVKSWVFRPALKDGTPVAYRKLITFEGY
jgi:hypothetical protein